jgi:hypothetical protein
VDALTAIVCGGSIPHSQGVVDVVLPLEQEGGQDNLEGKLDRRGRHGGTGVQ